MGLEAAAANRGSFSAADGTSTEFRTHPDPAVEPTGLVHIHGHRRLRRPGSAVRRRSAASAKSPKRCSVPSSSTMSGMIMTTGDNIYAGQPNSRASRRCARRRR